MWYEAVELNDLQKSSLKSFAPQLYQIKKLVDYMAGMVDRNIEAVQLQLCL